MRGKNSFGEGFASHFSVASDICGGRLRNGEPHPASGCETSPGVGD
ncbi:MULTISPECIES: hypothetical protein [unclassified Methanosarcina]|nr:MULTISPECIES: hypothetical protein [unclassified Methanosarcina]